VVEEEVVLEDSPPVLLLHECCQKVWEVEAAAVAGHLLGTRRSPQAGPDR
jgi:hypothetical protein